MFSPSSDWLPAIPLAGEDFIGSEFESENSGEKNVNLDKFINSRKILISTEEIDTCPKIIANKQNLKKDQTEC